MSDCGRDDPADVVATSGAPCLTRSVGLFRVVSFGAFEELPTPTTTSFGGPRDDVLRGAEDRVWRVSAWPTARRSLFLGFYGGSFQGHRGHGVNLLDF
jgi:hypothetical protein